VNSSVATAGKDDVRAARRGVASLSSGRTGRNGLNGFDPMPKRNQKTRDIENLLPAPAPVLAGNGVINEDAMHALILRGIQDSPPRVRT